MIFKLNCDMRVIYFEFISKKNENKQYSLSSRSRKFLHDQKDEIYQQGIHEFTGMNQLAEQVVRYDLDDMDVCWLQRMNEEREEMGKKYLKHTTTSC